MSSLLEDRQLKYIKTGTELVIETVKVRINKSLIKIKHFAF